MASPLLTAVQCPVCEPRWDLLPLECECAPLPPITASAYVPNFDSVPHAPMAADVETELCAVCGGNGCGCQWPTDSQGNLIPADEFCHQCKGNLMVCKCHESFQPTEQERVGVPCHICRFHLDVCKCDKTYEDTPSVFADFTGPSLWEAAMQAFAGTPNIPSKFTVRCYTPFQEDYKRILLFSSSTTRYEVYNYHIPEKGQYVLFYVTYAAPSIRSSSQKLPIFVDATFLPHVENVIELLQQLDCVIEEATLLGILGPAPLQEAWYDLTMQQILAAPILDGQPCLVHDVEDPAFLFEDIPCIHISL